MSETNDMRREFKQHVRDAVQGKAGEYLALNLDHQGNYCTAWVAHQWAGWQAATALATAMTDEKITQLWGDLQARNIKEKRERYKDQIGALCGACHVGTFFLNSNGYNDFPECAKCRHTPLFLDGVDMSAAAKKMREAIKPEQA